MSSTLALALLVGALLEFIHLVVVWPYRTSETELDRHHHGWWRF